MKVGIYARVSKQEQQTLPLQIKDLREYVETIPGGNNSESDVRCILPVMSERGVRVIHRRRTVHKCWWFQSWLTRQTGIKKH